MINKEPRKISTFKIVIGVLVFVFIATGIMSSGLFTTNAGVAAAKPMDINNVSDIVYTYEEILYKTSVDGENTALFDADVEHENNRKIGDTFSLGKDDTSFVFRTSEAGVYFKLDNGEYKLPIENIDIDSISLSPNEKRLMLVADNDLYLCNIKEKKLDRFSMVEENIDEASFTIGGDFVYKKGTYLYYSSGGYKAEIESNASVLTVSYDSMGLYYIRSNGELVRFRTGGKQGENGSVVIDENVSDMFYCGANYLAYIKDGEINIAKEIEKKSLNISADTLIY